MNKYILGTAALLLVAGTSWFVISGPWQPTGVNNAGGTAAVAGTRVDMPIKIGVITDLTGTAAYWGESTQVGAELAIQDLQTKGDNVQLIYENYSLEDPA